MARRLWQPFAAYVVISTIAACGGSHSDVRQTAFAQGVATSLRIVGFDTDVPWSCGDSDLQAVFGPSFTGESLMAATKSAIADPKKPDASFSFVNPIVSFFTDFPSRALCMTLEVTVTPSATDALVKQLRVSGNVTSVRAR